MTLSWPSGSETVAVASGRREVTLLSGFLGSGKTTLLRAQLDRAGADAPAVVLNDFGHTMVDDVLLNGERRRLVVLRGGCACCTRREDLARALAGLLDAEQAGSEPRRDVVIETSGLSDPGPIAFTVANDPVLKHHYALARICVTVDALTGLDSIERHEVALRQLLAADDLLVTKADLADASQVQALVARLHELNPSAAVTVTAKGELLRAEGAGSARTTRGDARRDQGVAHASAVSTLELTSDESLDWQAFSVWLSLLLHEHGPEVLRVKGILDVRHAGPVALNAVQHVVHRPEHLTGSVPPGTRLVLIVRDLEPELLERSFHAFLGID